MAVYKTYPSKDATIYSYYSTSNTGTDELLDIQNYYRGQEYHVSRAIVAFDTQSIQNVLTRYVGSSSFDVRLKMYLANASSLPVDVTLEAAAVSQSWTMGVGKQLDSPEDNSGVSWLYRNVAKTDAWATPGGDYISSSIVTADISYGDSNFDAEFDVTSIINSTLNGNIQNNGILIKATGSLEFSQNEYTLQYFSYDAATAFIPEFTVRWNDFVYNTGSKSKVEDITSAVVTANNMPRELQVNEIFRFTLNVRPQYPRRTFTTASLYVQNSYLPVNSYYSILDKGTLDEVVPFSEYTKISADTNSNYFDIYCTGLHAGRYYAVKIKMEENGQVVYKQLPGHFRITY